MVKLLAQFLQIGLRPVLHLVDYLIYCQVLWPASCSIALFAHSPLASRVLSGDSRCPSVCLDCTPFSILTTEILRCLPFNFRGPTLNFEYWPSVLVLPVRRQFWQFRLCQLASIRLPQLM